MSFLKDLIESEESVKDFEKEYNRAMNKKKPFLFGILNRGKNNDKKNKKQIKNKMFTVKTKIKNISYLCSGFGAILYK